MHKEKAPLYRRVNAKTYGIKHNPTLTAKDMKPFCSCCTHTFNGVLFGADQINL